MKLHRPKTRARLACGAVAVAALLGQAACTLIAGIGDYSNVDCVADCGAAMGEVPDGNGGTVDAPAGGVDASPDVRADGPAATGDADATAAVDGPDAAPDAAPDGPGPGDAAGAADGPGDAPPDGPKTISFVNYSSATYSSVTAVTIATPGGVVANDVLLVVLLTDKTSSSVTTPSGWTQIGNVGIVGDAHAWWYHRTAAASEPNQHIFNMEALHYAGVVMAAFRGARPPTDAGTSPLDAYNFAAGGTLGVQVVAPTVNPTVPNGRLVALLVADYFSGTANTWSTPAGMTPRAVPPQVAVFDEQLTGLAATGARSSNISGTPTGSAGALVVLAPAP